MTVDTLITGARVVTPGGTDDVAVGIAGGVITHVGAVDGLDAAEVVDGSGRLLTPALIDCHTHLVFGGDRIGEFEQRLGGATYEQIARAGGGIVSTVTATREASDEELYRAAARRIGWLMRAGVATIEIKSGYGLDAHHELRMLRVARRLGEKQPVRVRTSLLAAHAIPPDRRDDIDGYLDEICEEIIPAAADAGLADSVDAFCEGIAYSPDQVRRVFDTARSVDLPVRLHADQLTDLGGAGLAAEYQALSADHLEHASPEGVDALAAAGTVAVLIPGASAFLDEAARPPVDQMRRAGVRMAVATDLNPGTAPLGSLPLAMGLACTRFGLAPSEAFQGTTVHAAAALGLSDCGTIEVGKRADLALWDVDDPAALSYWFGAPLLLRLWIEGITVVEEES